MNLHANFPNLFLALLLSVTAANAQTTSNVNDTVIIVPVEGGNPGPGWHDSYSVGDHCYCETTYDHGIRLFQVETSVGWMTVEQACNLLGPGPGSNGRPVYNDVQCGNGPPNNAGDEHTCPGRTDIGPPGCGHIGPKWNFSGINLTDAMNEWDDQTDMEFDSDSSWSATPPEPETNWQNRTSYFVNCGPSDSEESAIISGTYWTDTTTKTVSNTMGYPPATFETARSGTSFTYTLTGFAPTVMANVTLGWAELWDAACAGLSRQFDVDVNGVEFVKDFDVSATAGGCNIAVFRSKLIEADDFGTFVLDFKRGASENPLISIIDIQVVGESTSLSRGSP